MSSEYKKGPRCSFIAGKKWYPFLVSQDGRDNSLSLLSNESYASDNIYVRRTYKGYYSFAVFGNAIELKKYIEGFHLAFRCFDEIVVSEPQKPRFDIDIENVDDMDLVLKEILNYLLDAIVDVIPSISLEYNIRIYTSHGPLKRSLHLIIDGLFHESHESAKGFYQTILMYIPGYLTKYVDSGIYGANKQLRIVSCCKWNDVRTKTLQEEFMYRDKTIVTKWAELDNEVTRFMSSLISIITNCTQLPSYAIEKKAIVSDDINDTISNAALNLARIIIGDNFTFEYTKTSGSLILLKRKAPSQCPTCGTIHEKEHPFLTVLGVNVYFNCRRNRFNKSFYVGRIDEVDNVKNMIALEPKKDIIEDPTSKVIRLGDKGAFIIKSKVNTKSDQEIKPVEVEETKVFIKKEKEPKEVTVERPSMKSDDIMNRLSSLHRAEKPRRPRKVRESQDLSSMIDIASFF